MTRRVPVLESPPPVPDKWAQFSTDQIAWLLCKRLGVASLGKHYGREEMIAMIERIAQREVLK